MIQVNARWGGRGGGRGGSRGGSRGGRGQAGTGRGGSFGRAGSYSSRGSSRGGSRGHLGKGVYRSTSYGTVGRPNSGGSYNTSTIRDSRGRVLSTSRAYGLARADGGFGQVGTGRGSFRISGRRGSFGGTGRRFGGGGVSRQTAAVAPPSGGGGGDDDDGTTPTPGSGTERSLRIRNSPARRTAFGRGRRAQGSRRSLRIGRSVGGLGSGGSRSGVNV